MKKYSRMDTFWILVFDRNCLEPIGKCKVLGVTTALGEQELR